jgi:hypothetical protein
MKTIASVRKLGERLTQGMLVTAVCEGANVRSRKGFDQLRAFAKRKGYKVDDKVIRELLRDAMVSGPDQITSVQRTRILFQASRLNGTRDTDEGKLYLRVFAAKEFSIIIDNHTITQILHRDEVSTDSGRRWCQQAIVRPSGFMVRAKPYIPDEDI